MDLSNPKLIGGAIGLVAILIVFAFRFRQMSRSTPYDPNRALIYPVVLTGLAAWFVMAVHTGGIEWLWLLLAFVVGGGLGWLRASTVQMSVDAATGRLRAQGSLMAILFLVGLLIVRSILRWILTTEAGAICLRPIMADVIFVAMAVGLLVARALEMNLRGRKLLALHRVSPALMTTDAAGI